MLQNIGALCNVITGFIFVPLLLFYHISHTRRVAAFARELQKIRQLQQLYAKFLNPMVTPLADEMLEKGPLTPEQQSEFVEKHQLKMRKEFMDWIQRIKAQADPTQMEKLEMLESEMNGLFDVASSLSHDSSDEYRERVMQDIGETLAQIQRKMHDME